MVRVKRKVSLSSAPSARYVPSEKDGHDLSNSFFFSSSDFRSMSG